MLNQFGISNLPEKCVTCVAKFFPVVPKLTLIQSLSSMFYDDILRRMTGSMQREAAIHMRLRHASIVSMIGVVFDLDNQGFVLELVKFGSYSNFLKYLHTADGLLSNICFQVFNMTLNLKLQFTT